MSCFKKYAALAVFVAPVFSGCKENPRNSYEARSPSQEGLELQKVGTPAPKASPQEGGKESKQFSDLLPDSKCVDPGKNIIVSTVSTKVGGTLYYVGNWNKALGVKDLTDDQYNATKECEDPNSDMSSKLCSDLIQLCKIAAGKNKLTAFKVGVGTLKDADKKYPSERGVVCGCVAGGPSIEINK